MPSRKLLPKKQLKPYPLPTWVFFFVKIQPKYFVLLAVHCWVLLQCNRNYFSDPSMLPRILLPIRYTVPFPPVPSWPDVPCWFFFA